MTRNEAQSDEALFLLHRDGHPTALATLIDRYRGPVMTYLVRTVGSRALAEEVFVDTFVALHKAADKYESQGAFRSFVFRIARNRAVSSLRRPAERAVRKGVSIDTPDDPDDRRPRLQLVHGGAGPDRLVSARRRLDRVERALAALPERHRTALLLYNVEGMPYPEIAESLDVPLGTVKTWIHQARKRLRKQLGEEYSDVGR